MDVHHQVSSCCILHYKTHMLLGLEASKEIDQERVPDTVDRLEDPLLTHQTVEQNASHRHVGKLAHTSHLIRLSKVSKVDFYYSFFFFFLNCARSQYHYVNPFF